MSEHDVRALGGREGTMKYTLFLCLPSDNVQHELQPSFFPKNLKKKKINGNGTRNLCTMNSTVHTDINVLRV